MNQNQIKFRVWHKEFKKFLPKEEWVVDFDGNLYFCLFDDGGYILERVHKSFYVIQRWTGLKDKNGKEIYEGDIIKEEFDATCMNFNGKDIICLPGKYMRKKFDFVEVKWEGLGLVFNRPNHVGIITNKTQEIVGNIFENPDLLHPPTSA